MKALILTIGLIFLASTAFAVMPPILPCHLDTATGGFIGAGCPGDSGFFFKGSPPGFIWTLGGIIIALVYDDLTKEQIEGFPGQQWDTCANPNPPSACYEQWNVLTPYLWTAPHHAATGRTASFLRGKFAPVFHPVGGF